MRSLECRASNGLYYRVLGRGAPLLLLHGLMASGAMFDPLADILKDEFRLLIPDLRGHGNSRRMGAPYDVVTLADDLNGAMAESEFGKGAVLGYSHGGAVAQALARARPDAVSQLLLVCTYAYNAATWREYLETLAFIGVLSTVGPRTVAKLITQPSRAMSGITPAKVAWLRGIFAANGRRQMRGAAQGLLKFDSRAWLEELAVPVFVIAAANDVAVPAHHFETLMSGIPQAQGHMVQGAGHTLLWTHTEQLAALIRKRCRRETASDNRN
jgi:pimeloyl-ACP methyl ester carboxylesterase